MTQRGRRVWWTHALLSAAVLFGCACVTRRFNFSLLERSGRHELAFAGIVPYIPDHKRRHPRAVACPSEGAARLPGDEVDLQPAARVLGQNAWPRVRPLWDRPATVQLSQAYQLARMPPCQHGCAHTNYGRQLQSRRAWHRVRVLEGTEGRDTSMAPVGAHSYQASTQAQRHAHRGGRRDAPSRAAAR